MRRVAAVGVAVALFMGACGDDDGDSGGAPAAPDNTFVGLLDQIPDTDETRAFVVLNDFDAARHAAGIEQPDPDADEDDLVDYVLGLTVDVETGVSTYPAIYFGARSGASEDDWRDEFGFAFSDFDRDAAAGKAPDMIEIFEGRIDPDAVDHAVQNDDVWSEVLEEESHAGVDFYSWGTDRDPDRATPVRPLGVGGTLLVDDATAVLTREADAMEEVIDVRAGDEPSLADDEDFVELATAMQDLGAYSAILSDEPITLGPELVLTPEAIDELEEFALAPYTAYAIGGGLDDDGPYLALTLVHSDADAAEENVDRLERIVDEGTSGRGVEWAEFLEVDEITADGPLLTARLRLLDAPPGLWIRVAQERDTLVAAAAG